MFVASGRAHQLRDGKIVAAIAVRENVSGVEHINNYMITSADHGVTWTASTGRAELDGDEAKVVELNNGNIMMSIRNSGTRRFNISTDKGATWGAPKTIFAGASAYSSLTILPDGTIGIYYENGES